MDQMTPVQSLAQTLLDTHVAFVCKRLNAANLQQQLGDEVDFLLANAPLLTLHDCVNASMIKETVHRYAVELELGAGVFEIIGEIARTIHGHNIHHQTTLGDLMPDHHFQQLLDKILELRQVREYMIHELVANPVYSALVSDVLYHSLRSQVLAQTLAGKKAGSRALLSWGKDLLRNMPAGFEESVEFNLRRYVQKSISAALAESERFLLNMDIDTLKNALLDIWDDLKNHRTSTHLQLLTSLDVEEMFVLIYEFWRDFRQTDYFSALINAGIDAFFNRYGDTTLDVLLDEVGIKRDMLVADALRFAPPVLQVLREKNLLEPLVRRQLQPFYQSEELLQALAAG